MVSAELKSDVVGNQTVNDQVNTLALGWDDRKVSIAIIIHCQLFGNVANAPPFLIETLLPVGAVRALDKVHLLGSEVRLAYYIVY